MISEQQLENKQGRPGFPFTFSSGETESVSIFANCGEIEVRLHDFRLEAIDARGNPASARIIRYRSGEHGLAPDMSPGRSFDLPGGYARTPPGDGHEGTAGMPARLLRTGIEPRAI